MEIPLLTDMIIIFGLSMAVLFFCHRLHVPTIVGFFLTGILAGPHGLGLINAVREVEILAEIGVVLLLFTIGLEFSLKDLLRIKRLVLVGGMMQVSCTIAVVLAIVNRLGQGFSVSILAGFLVSLSSTAIVLKLLQDRAEIESPQGLTSVGILIFQDIIIVPMILLTPLLAGVKGDLGGSLAFLLAKGAAIVLLVIVSAQWIVPQLLYQIARTRNRELFLLSVVVICIGIAWLTHSIGLSLALGAFLAGLIISESEYSHQALGSILPFRDLFTSFFFVSIGMLLNVGFFAQRPSVILVIALCILALKASIAAFTTTLLGFPLRTAILVGFTISQVGEFSFVLSKTAVEHGLLPGNLYQIFLAVSVLTMASTPFLIPLGSLIADLTLKAPLPKRLKSGLYPLRSLSDSGRKVTLRDHIVIIGFGLNGRNMAQAARFANIPYLIIEMNPETVRTERTRGEPIYYGDAGHEAILDHANIRDARIAVVVISDPTATRRITALARRLNPKIYIIARTRFLPEMQPLYELGANEVIPEEFETSVEIFARVLLRYLVPRNEIERFIADIRADGYEMFRSFTANSATLCDLESYIPDMEIHTFRVAEGSPVVGRSLSEIGLRKKYGITLLAIRRDKQLVSSPGGDTTLLAGDVLILFAPPAKLAGVIDLFQRPAKSPKPPEISQLH